MGNVMWWIGVLALAGFFELWHRIGFTNAITMLGDFFAETGPRDAAERRAHSDWRLYGVAANVPEKAPEQAPVLSRDEWDGQHCLLRPDEVVDYPDTGPAPVYRYAPDDPRNWPVQKWSDRR